MPELNWAQDIENVDWDELHELYLAAPLGDKPADALRTVFTNSMFRCFAYADGKLVGAGRALADGLDCAYIGDVAVRPEHQGAGLGKEIIRRLVDQAKGHKKIILYANPGKEGFYRKLGFLPMTTAMGMWQDQSAGIAAGVLEG
jgi:GNAT superfamily N-acetyltransferase